MFVETNKIQELHGMFEQEIPADGLSRGFHEIEGKWATNEIKKPKFYEINKGAVKQCGRFGAKVLLVKFIFPGLKKWKTFGRVGD